MWLRRICRNANVNTNTIYIDKLLVIDFFLVKISDFVPYLNLYIYSFFYMKIIIYFNNRHYTKSFMWINYFNFFFFSTVLICFTCFRVWKGVTNLTKYWEIFMNKNFLNFKLWESLGILKNENRNNVFSFNSRGKRKT